MSASEKKLWTKLSKKMKQAHGAKWHATRIETGATALGVPDVNYGLNGHENHIELKFAKNFKEWCELRPSQYQWMKKRLKSSGKPCWVIVEVQCPQVFLLISSVYAEELITSKSYTTWTSLATASWHGELDIPTLSLYLSGETK